MGSGVLQGYIIEIFYQFTGIFCKSYNLGT